MPQLAKRRWRVVVSMTSAVVMTVGMGACGSFGGSDAPGGKEDGGSDASNADGTLTDGASSLDAAELATDAGTNDGSAVDASFDACTTVSILTTGDTYIVEDATHCNSNMSYGDSMSLMEQSGTPTSVAIARFVLSSSDSNLLDSTAHVVVTATGAACNNGNCFGSVYPMRSDWSELAGSQGADWCRRDFPDGYWSSDGGPMSAPGDFDTNPAGTTTVSSGMFTSSALAPTALAARLLPVAGGKYQLSLMFTVGAGGSVATFKAREAAGAGMMLNITHCAK